MSLGWSNIWPLNEMIIIFNKEQNKEKYKIILIVF